MNLNYVIALLFIASALRIFYVLMKKKCLSKTEGSLLRKGRLLRGPGTVSYIPGM